MFEKIVAPHRSYILMYTSLASFSSSRMKTSVAVSGAVRGTRTILFR